MAAVDSFQILADSIFNVCSEHRRQIIDVVTIIGAWYAFRFAVDVSYHTVKHVSVVARRPRNFVKDYGRWAIVTGCTSGMGQQFSYQLADRGLNIVLIARNDILCNEQARFIEKRYGVRTLVIIHDFNATKLENYSQIAKELAHLDVGILINNAGMHYDYPMEFAKVPLERVSAISQVNVSGLVMLTRSVLPLMIARRRGLIVNISSVAGLKPFPLISLYSASKAFASHFTSSLASEVEQHNIDVQTLEPMYVSTRMTSFSSTLSSMSPDARTYVKNAMKALGRSSTTSAYYSHTIQMLVIKWCPDWIVRTFSYRFQKYLGDEGIRSKRKME